MTPENPVPILQLLPIPWNHQSYFCLLRMCLAWAFSINGIVELVVFCVCLLSLCMCSGFIHVVSMYQNFILFCGLSVYSLMDVWVVSTFDYCE